MIALKELRKTAWAFVATSSSDIRNGDLYLLIYTDLAPYLLSTDQNIKWTTFEWFVEFEWLVEFEPIWIWAYAENDKWQIELGVRTHFDFESTFLIFLPSSFFSKQQNSWRLYLYPIARDSSISPRV